MAGLPALPTSPTCAEVYQSLKNYIANPPNGGGSLITNFNAGGVADTMLKAISVAFGSDASSLPNVQQPGAFERLDAVQSDEFISTASGTALDLKCLDVGVKRKDATTAVGIIQVTIPGGSTVTQGVVCIATLADPTIAPVQFTVNADTVVPSNTPTDVAITCTETGSIGNVDPGTITQIQFAGATCSNAAATAFGTDTEQDDTPNGGLRARGLAAIPNDTDCTVPAIANDALAFDGIVSSTVIDLTDTDGTTPALARAQLYVSDADGNIGDPTSPNYPILQSIIAVFNSGQHRAAGCIVGVHGSIQDIVTVALTVYMTKAYVNAGGTALALQNMIQLAVQNTANETVISAALRLSKIVTAAQSVDDGIAVDHVVDTTVLINGSNSDYTPANSHQVHITDPTTIMVTVAGTV